MYSHYTSAGLTLEATGPRLPRPCGSTAVIGQAKLDDRSLCNAKLTHGPSFPREYLLQYGLCPLEWTADGTFTVAAATDLSSHVLDDLELTYGGRVNLTRVPPEEVEAL